jgi:putative modified peptide
MANQSQTLALLQGLAEDDELRARMETDPVATLAEFGFVVDPSIAPERVSLPSKEHLRENADKFARQLEATSGWIIFCR